MNGVVRVWRSKRIYSRWCRDTLSGRRSGPSLVLLDYESNYCKRAALEGFLRYLLLFDDVRGEAGSLVK
jgi:hypothetical protein